jgi:hypothetical protein
MCCSLLHCRASSCAVHALMGSLSILFLLGVSAAGTVPAHFPQRFPSHPLTSLPRMMRRGSETPPAAAKPTTPKKSADAEKVRPGMTAEEVRRAWGNPTRMRRQILFGRYLEQWSFDRPLPCCVEFERLPGKPLAVRTIRRIHPTRR